MSGNEELGHHLAALRDRAGLTLREVEERTEGAVKNSYLSQIERGYIKRPSPDILWSLAEVYSADYNDLLRRAKHRVASNAGELPTVLNGIPLSALKDLDEDDAETVRRIVEVLREQKSKRREGNSG